MKKLFVLLMIAALALGLVACGGEPNDSDAPTDAQSNAAPFQMATELAQALEESIPASTTTQGTDPTQENAQAQPKQSATPTTAQIEEIFQPAIEMYGILCLCGASYDYNDRFGYDDWGNNRWEYAHVTDPRFPSRAAVEKAALKIFSEELVLEYMSLTAESCLSEGADDTRREKARQLPLLMEKDGKLYTLVQSRGGNLSLKSIRIKSQSESKIVYTLRAVSPWEGEPVVDEEYSYTRELFGGKWVFTVFPMDWY